MRNTKQLLVSLSVSTLFCPSRMHLNHIDCHRTLNFRNKHVMETLAVPHSIGATSMAHEPLRREIYLLRLSSPLRDLIPYATLRVLHPSIKYSNSVVLAEFSCAMMARSYDKTYSCKIRSCRNECAVACVLSNLASFHVSIYEPIRPTELSFSSACGTKTQT